MSCQLVRSVAFLALASGIARAQSPCPRWEPGFEHVLNGVTSTDHSTSVIGNIQAMCVFDEGSGPRLFVGGFFDRAGSLAISNVGRWDGSSWSDVQGGAGPGGGPIYPKSLVVHDDGTGPAMYAVGYFDPDVVRWDGTGWSQVGTGQFPGIPSDLVVFDDGGGSKLYSSENGFALSGQAYGKVHVWNGTTWSQIGGEFNGHVYGFAVYDDGAGSALYAGGAFGNAGGTLTRGVVKWTGSSWAALGSGFPAGSEVETLAVFDEGAGPALFAGGFFTGPVGTPSPNLARWDGASWTAVGVGVNGRVNTLRTFDLGAGTRLYAAGNLTSAGGVPSGDVVAWDGSSFSSLGTRGVEGEVAALEIDPASPTPALYAAGYFTHGAGREMNSIMRWDGSAWSPLGPASNGMNDQVHVLASLDIGIGAQLYAGGKFTTASGNEAAALARWDGSGWKETGSDLFGEVDALAVFDAGGGPQLYLGGSVGSSSAGYSLLRWNGSSLSGVPGSSNAVGVSVLALASYDGGSGKRLYAGGTFNNFTYHAIASWNGATWSDVGGGTNGAVNALAVHDDGGGPLLYVGGAFTLPANYLATWDGTAWGTLPSAPGGPVRALCSFDDGNGTALYVAGAFTHVGGVAASNIAKWNGTSWDMLGSGVNGVVNTMTVFDDGSGLALYVGGTFTMAGGIGALFVAKWDGTAWSAVDNGTNGAVFALAGNGPDLFVGGGFTSAGGIPSSYIAQWRACTSPGVPLCFGDGTLATPCPCANFGAAGHGCQNSSLTGGAILGSTGATVPDTVVLFAEGERPSALTIFLQGTQNHVTGLVFGDGLRCATGTLKRLYTKNASGGAVAAPTAGEPSITARSAALGDPIASGARRYYQTYYRDSNLTFCPAPVGNTFNSSNAVKIVW